MSTIDEGEWGPPWPPLPATHPLVTEDYCCNECGEPFRAGSCGRLQAVPEAVESQLFLRAKVDGRWGTWPAVPVCTACAPHPDPTGRRGE